MFQRINVGKIIVDHFRTLRRLNDNKVSKWDFSLFVFFPLSVAITFTYFNVGLSNHITDLITSVSIIGGFLFNLLAIIYGLMDKIKDDAAGNPIKKVFVKEVHINISFNILVSLFLLVVLIIHSYVDHSYTILWQLMLYKSLTALIYFLLILFLLTMLMILNRVYILLKKD
jgi:hypothetical protein